MPPDAGLRAIARTRLRPEVAARGQEARSSAVEAPRRQSTLVPQWGGGSAIGGIAPALVFLWRHVARRTEDRGPRLRFGSTIAERFGCSWVFRAASEGRVSIPDVAGSGRSAPSRITGPFSGRSGAGVTIRLTIAGPFRFFLGARFGR